VITVSNKPTKPGQFLEFMNRLMDSKKAPEGYKPFLFPVQKDNKAPSTNISWKAPQSRLTIAEARKRLAENNGNVGIAGRPDDRLILLDIDDPSIEEEIKPTLKIRSRSRSGTHAIYWADSDSEVLPVNIPTEKGELRSSDQYVVAPGSFVPCNEQELEEKINEGEITEKEKEKILKDKFKGYYTIDNDKDIAEVTLDELPDVFREQYEKSKKNDKHTKEENFTPEKKKAVSEGSALFQLEITDLTGRGLTERDPHPLHASVTGKNWSIGQGVGQCWRHQVSLNGLQFLCVESGYMTCLEAGSPHHNSSAGESKVRGDDQAIWEAWRHAKKQGYIPEDDPIPTRAMHYIARKHDIYEPEKGSMLPKNAYNQVIKTVEVEY
jgi:putative DNA primase/helicase